MTLKELETQLLSLTPEEKAQAIAIRKNQSAEETLRGKLIRVNRPSG